MEYRIVQGESQKEFEKECTILLQEGWHPQWNIIITPIPPNPDKGIEMELIYTQQWTRSEHKGQQQNETHQP